MKKKKIPFILNPAAGGGQGLAKLNHLREKIELFDLPAEIILSQSEDHLLQLIRNLASQERLLVGIGGDSTFNLMANELLKTGGISTLAFVGLGSSNDIPREFGLLTLDQAFQAIKEGREKLIDVAAIIYQGKIIQYVLGQVNIGLGVIVNEYISKLISRRSWFRHRQNLAGLLAILSAYRKKQNLIPLSIETRNQFYSDYFTIALLTNLRYWATGRMIAPKASPEDGLFDLCLIKASSLGLFLYIALLASRGRHLNLAQVITTKDNWFRVSSEKKFRLQADGEIIKIGGKPFETDHFELQVLPRVLRIIA
ncbi:MAG: diacylglycerol kinase family protein [Candidatus Aminicenantes bacterium]|nr:diacylglycerol kinase family protein [Candidatus Aminicenantes bacterium]